MKSIFLAGSEVVLDGSNTCLNFILTQSVEESVVKRVDGLKLVFVEDRLKEVYKVVNGKFTSRALSDIESNLQYFSAPPNKIFSFQNEDGDSSTYLGPSKPEGFVLPSDDLPVRFGMLGKIAKVDVCFNWLPFDLPIFFAIDSDLEKLTLDYSDPLQPEILNLEEVELAEAFSEEDDFYFEDEEGFVDTHFTIEEVEEFPDSFHAGVPNWHQYPDIPVCPKTGELMRFVCQISSEVNILHGDPEGDLEEESFDFWGGGELYIFFHPQSKVCTIIRQNT